MFDNQFPSFGSLNPMSESQKQISELDFNEILKFHLFIFIGYFQSYLQVTLGYLTTGRILVLIKNDSLSLRQILILCLKFLNLFY